MGEPTVMFCTGATKAGTSWLHAYLEGHPECHFRSIKELHYFDALDEGRLDRRAAQIAAARDALADKRAAAPVFKRRKLAARIADHDAYLSVLERGTEDCDAYLGYLCDGVGRARVVGDVTPAYGLLSAERLAAMARMASDVRFVYLLRDPVDRLWSHVRMMAARRSDSGKVDPARAANILKRTISGEETQIVRRSDYQGALETLFAAVPQARRLVAFYEDLFTGDAVARICAHLGISAQPAPVDAVVHGGQPLEMTGEQRRAARDWLAPQYDFVTATLGDVPARWQTDLAKV
ncbi:MAG: sulfotransferase [Alphaproteobacteria bacterium]|nr:sulfotransferase [Alphaproteobacteria bacterium]